MRAVFGHERRALYSLAIYAVALGVVDSSVPLVMQAIVSNVAATALVQPVVILAIGLLVALGAGGFLQAAKLAIVEGVIVRYFIDAARRFMADAHLRPHSALKFYDVVVVQKSLSLFLVEAPMVVLQILTAVLLLSIYHPALLVFALGFAGAIAFYVWAFLSRGTALAVAASAEKHAVAAAIIELKPDADSSLRAYRTARGRYFRVLWWQTVVSHLIVAFASAAFLAIGLTLLMNGELSLGQLVAAEIVIALAAQSLTKTPKLLEKVHDLVAALAKIEGAAAPKPRAALVKRRSLPLVARLTSATITAAALVLMLVPWRQTAFSRGRVIAYAPTDRQQTVEAPIEGRIVRWHVQEGQRVKQGDPLVDISDNDPAILSRLTAEREALHLRLEATQRRAAAVEERVGSLGESRLNAQAGARARVAMAKQRASAAVRARDAAVAALTVARANVERQRKLAAEGLASARTVELAELDDARSHAEQDRAEAALSAAQEELASLEADQRRVTTDADAQIGDARAVLAAAEAEMASAEAEIARMDVRLARQSSQAVAAPRDGVVLRVVANAPGGAVVKTGDPLLVLVPETADRAAELFVSGLDAPLIQPGQVARLQFEGWPAVQFAGWPQVAIGTFEARVALVDAASDESGRLRVVVVESQPGSWPEPRYLRQGVRAQGWVLLGEVKLGFELWRRLNGFPASLPSAPSSESGGKEKASS